jgi:GT2 family glycosyltransferase
MVLRRGTFFEVGGFDEAFAVCYNDVDLCLRLSSRGYRIVWTPDAELYHHENISRSDRDKAARAQYAREVALMHKRWGKQLQEDPAHNPNLALHGEAVLPAARVRAPRLW